ncbi:MAG: hypothetical protein ACI977_000425 [Candidatus Nanohaloarchaea archaeon]|jgi:hypothetical protein
MDSVENYIEYAGVFALSLLAVSAVYLIDFSRPITAFLLLTFPILYGFVASISTEGFNRASLISLLSLVLAPVDLFMAAAAVFISFTTVLISFFSSGKQFRDFYGSTALPLLLTGLIVSSGLFVAASTSQQFGNKITNTTANVVGSQTQNVIETTGIVGSQQQQQARIVEATSQNSVVLTQQYVLNETREDFNRDQIRSLNQAFQGAEQEIPDRLSSEIEDRDLDVDVEGQMEDLVRDNFDQKLFIVIIPLLTLLIYSLQPAVGLLTAVVASIIVRFRHL